MTTTAATLNRYASQLAGEPVTIACERDSRFQDGAGEYVYYDGDTLTFDSVIHLPRKTCNALYRLVSRDSRRLPTSAAGLVTNGGAPVDLPDGRAVHVLLHGATHIRESSSDEGRVECDTYRNGWQAVRLFGFPASEARQILRGMTVAHRESRADYLTVC